ncbi:MAG: NUMOD4 motif-containing HNH endonuclease [Methanobrevibacter sp.]|nr:NUMOD4 motif-containing HNH endonuclease [Methanobrevibacter sp.]
MEEWRDIEGYEGLYQISDWGNVKRLERIIERYSSRANRNITIKQKEKIYKGIKNDGGYYITSLTKNGTHNVVSVHRLVAKAFITNPENKPFVDHLNTIKTDNRAENLRWCTREENNNNPYTKLHRFGKLGYSSQFNRT